METSEQGYCHAHWKKQTACQTPWRVGNRPRLAHIIRSRPVQVNDAEDNTSAGVPARLLWRGRHGASAEGRVVPAYPHLRASIGEALQPPIGFSHVVMRFPQCRHSRWRMSLPPQPRPCPSVFQKLSPLCPLIGSLISRRRATGPGHGMPFDSLVPLSAHVPSDKANGLP